MSKNITPSFITEITLIVSSQQEKELLALFQAARQLYNACLSEAMARLNLLRNSQQYQQMRSLPRAQKKLRNQVFSEARKTHRYSEYDLHS